jgi:broad specificity phosphatase PhoE
VCVCVCVFEYMYVCVCVCVCVCVYMYMYVHTYVCVSVHTQTHTHTHQGRSANLLHASGRELGVKGIVQAHQLQKFLRGQRARAWHASAIVSPAERPYER